MWSSGSPVLSRRLLSLLPQHPQRCVFTSSSSSSSSSSLCRTHQQQQRQQQQEQRRVFSSSSSSSSSSGVKNKLLLTLASPTESYFLRSPVLSVSVPGSEGQMTITNNHSALAARLKAGEVLVYEKEGAPPKRFFLSDGFAFVNTSLAAPPAADAVWCSRKSSAAAAAVCCSEKQFCCCRLLPQDDRNCGVLEVLGVEVLPSHLLDKEAAAQQLQQLLQAAAAAHDPWTKAKALLGYAGGFALGGPQE
ncbi:hypothetical protein ACSSS7_003472 [Eimeria intestinalis]